MKSGALQFLVHFPYSQQIQPTLFLTLTSQPQHSQPTSILIHSQRPLRLHDSHSPFYNLVDYSV
eukprot:COSAG02_NODE_195_length_29750_cov_79.793329_28_plen_64_part_00